MTNTNREAERRPSFDLAVLLILLLAIAFRLYRIDIPFIEGHSWRQVTNADIARHYAEGSMNLFMPRVSWGGLNGAVGMEFPLLHYLTAIAWRIGGESHIVARLIAMAFSLASVVLIFLLGRRWFGAPAGRAAAFLFAVSPTMVFFGRAFMSDTPMVTFLVAAVLAWDWYFERPQPNRLIVAVVLTALAPLVKLPAIVVLAPIGGLALSWLGWGAFRSRAVWFGCATAVAAVAAWYWHADRIFLETGLTQAVFRPSGTYPADVAPDVFFLTTFHFATAERLLNPEFWYGMADRFWGQHLTAAGFVGHLHRPVLLLWAPDARLPVLLWALGAFTLIVVSAEGQWNHEFHQLPMMPPLALLFGVGAAPLFDAEYLRRYMRIGLAVAVVELRVDRHGCSSLSRVERDSSPLPARLLEHPLRDRGRLRADGGATRRVGHHGGLHRVRCELTDVGLLRAAPGLDLRRRDHLAGGDRAAAHALQRDVLLQFTWRIVEAFSSRPRFLPGRFRTGAVARSLTGPVCGRGPA